MMSRKRDQNSNYSSKRQTGSDFLSARKLQTINASKAFTDQKLKEKPTLNKSLPKIPKKNIDFYKETLNTETKQTKQNMHNLANNGQSQ